MCIVSEYVSSSTSIYILRHLSRFGLIVTQSISYWTLFSLYLKRIIFSMCFVVHCCWVFIVVFLNKWFKSLHNSFNFFPSQRKVNFFSREMNLCTKDMYSRIYFIDIVDGVFSPSLVSFYFVQSLFIIPHSHVHDVNRAIHLPWL